MSTPNQASNPSINTLALLGSYVPRRCGIGTFTKDLRDALTREIGEHRTLVLAMDDEPAGYDYPDDVRFQIRAHEQRDYRTAAEMLNINQIDLTVVQHEYGIYGGQDGSYVLDLMRRLRMPTITTLHTVLTEPTEGQSRVMREIGRISDRLVVMSHLASDILKDNYDVPKEKVCFIPHGIPDVPFVDPSFHKDQFGFEDRTVMLTFGLLSPNKGIEVALRAMPKIAEKHPEVVYIVLGATHPHILRSEGDAYRNNLERMVDKLGVRDHVVFHNRFVELDELVRYIGAADIYLTPYLNEAQITSGTLAYALGAGKAVVSTPYWYAAEMLGEDRGKLVPFKDPDAMAEAVNALLDNDVERNAMRKRAYMHCREMVWSNVARQYIELAERIAQERARRPRTTVQIRTTVDASDAIPAISLDHFITLNDDTGMFSHARYAVPDRRHGYATDDNARALITALLHHDLRKNARLTPMITGYLAFLNDAYNRDAERFRYRLGYDRRWQDEAGSEQTHARALWALGLTTQLAPTEGLGAFATRLFTESLPPAEHFQTPAAWAIALVGIHAYLSRYGGDTAARRIREHLAERLFGAFEAHANAEWAWHEPTLSAESAKLPHALILAGQWLPEPRMTEQGLVTLEWLCDLQLNGDGSVSLIGDHGWMDNTGRRANFDQRPTEAMHLIEACAEAYRCTRDGRWIARARQTLNWFLGDNDTQAPLYDSRTGGCRDGLHSDGANLNQGGEATAAWLISLMNVYALMREEAADTADHLADQPEVSVEAGQTTAREN